MSRVSIIVPVYNGEKSLKRCVDSLLNQDYKDIEIILVDDGSKDGSYQIISEYAGKDERIVPVHKDNSGVSATRNIALSLAKGEYVRFVDVDDFLPFDSVKMMVRAMEEDGSDLVVADFYRVIDDKVSRKGSIRKGGILGRNEYAEKMLLSPADFYFGALWNKLYRKKLIDDYHLIMDENISYSEDAIFNLQYLLHVDLVSILKSPVYYYVKTEGSLVASNMNVQSTVRMKTSVIHYYNDFYKQILDEDEYEAKKPIIYGYLVAISTDALALPVFDDAKKLGEESGVRFFLEGNIASDLQIDRLSIVVFDRFLSVVAQQNRLELAEIRILYYLCRRKEQASTEEIANACAITPAACALSLAKLTAASYIRISDVRLFEDDKVYYEYIPSLLDQQFDKAEEDYRALLYDGLSIEEVADYARIRKQIFANMKKTLIR